MAATCLPVVQLQPQHLPELHQLAAPCGCSSCRRSLLLAGNRPAGAPGAGGPPAGFGGGRGGGARIKAYPLLFGVNLERKPAYFAVTDFKK
jgi:hypothetical protein